MAQGKYKEWLTPEGLLKLESWARDGLIDEQIAANIGIRRPTLYAWKKEHPDIADALKKGKEVVDIQVENALLKRALGYAYEEKTYETQWDEAEAKFKEGLTKRVIKEVVPDTTAQIFWLKNRRPDKWRDRKDVEHSGGIDIKQTYENMSEEELLELAGRYEKINKK